MRNVLWIVLAVVAALILLSFLAQRLVSPA
jgi:hypothetical protein